MRSKPAGLLVYSTVLFGLTLASLLWNAGTAEAKCWPNRPNDGQGYHAGWYSRPGTTVRGMEVGLMLNYDPWVQPGSRVTAWPMLTRPDYANWAQIGWREFAYDERYTFVQYTYLGVAYTFHYAPEPEGQFSRYTNLFDPGVYPNPPTWTFQVNGVTKKTISSLQWTPTEGQVSGELHTLASQMPGGTNAHQIFWGMKMYYSGAWRDFNGAPVAMNGQYFGRTPTNPTTVGEIWDKACTS
jgi:hypothetical protein